MTTRRKRMGVLSTSAMFAALISGSLGPTQAVTPEQFNPVAHRREAGPKLPRTNKNKFDGTRKTRRQMRAAERAAENAFGRGANQAAKRERTVDMEASLCGDPFRSPEQRQLINRMSNWQNHQWMKAGCPMAINQLKSYASLFNSYKIQQRLRAVLNPVLI